jgi:hypothetical protein
MSRGVGKGDSMSEIVKTEATLENLAAEINDYHAKCEEAVGQAVSYAMEAGDRLAKVKEGLGHGEWLPWLEKNFKGTPRTAQAYMRIASNRKELEMRSTASHLSIRGALKELSAPKEEDIEAGEENSEDLTDEQVVELVRAFMEMEGPTELSDIEQAAMDKRLAKPGQRERDLLSGIHYEHIMMYGSQVAQDGFILDVRDGKAVVEWRSPDKKKLYRFAMPEPGKSKLPESERERVKRGSKVYGVLEFQVWRLLSNWFTELLIAEVDDLEEVEQRIIMHHGDWKRAEPAGEYLRDKLLHEGFNEDRKLDMKKWALRHQVPDLEEFADMVAGVEVWADLRAKSLEDRLVGGEQVQ